MREEFEKLPEIKEALQLIDGFDGYKYHSINNHRTADWLNGAYYAYQEQQKKLQHIYDYCTECTTVSELLDSIRGLLK